MMRDYPMIAWICSQAACSHVLSLTGLPIGGLESMLQLAYDPPFFQHGIILRIIITCLPSLIALLY